MDFSSLSGNALRYYHTLRHLRPQQLFFQIYYRTRRVLERRSTGRPLEYVACFGTLLSFAPFVPKHPSWENGAFTFLNQTKTFGGDVGAIDWEFSGYGKLWAYNLSYFDFLLQPGIDRETGLSLIDGFMTKVHRGSTRLEPYPISLRGINWIKFLSLHMVERADIDALLYVQYRRLFRGLEYHLLGNHLLENAFSLLYGAFYFREHSWYKKACNLLYDELEEQVLDDGAHFELSPMYHQILLDRLLDCVNLIQYNRVFDGQGSLLSFLQEKARTMLGWLKAVSFSDGSIPHVNDATDGIAPASGELFAYAERLGFGEIRRGALRDSGYRKFEGSWYECIFDVGRIGPDYIPGHAHADTFNLVLYVQGRQFLVDAGTSTYEKGALRDEERGTAAHNTVVVNGENSSDVWGGFRVGRAARVKVLEEDENNVLAEHDGYKHIGVIHRRFWGFEESRIVILDELRGRADKAEARFHFDHVLNPLLDSGVVTCQDVQLSFKGALSVYCETYRQALGFNHSVEARCVVVKFSGTLETEISIA